MKDFRAFLFDLDGVVYRGNHLLAGARELVEWADASGRQVLYLSNNSFATQEEVAAKLARLGMPRPEERVLTAGWAAVQAIAERFPGGRVYVLGVPSVEGMAEAVGLRVVWREQVEAEVPDVVLVGLDRNLTYERLKRGLRAILGGAAFVAVNRDPRLPIEDGFEPGTGAIAAALQFASGQEAEIIGKPASGIVRQALARLGVTENETLMVGDGLDLDIVAGHAAGVPTCLVLTGLTSAAEAEAATGTRKPDYVFADMFALLAAVRAGG